MGKYSAMNNIQAIQAFFGPDNGGRKVEMPEFKNLTTEDRKELGDLIRASE